MQLRKIRKVKITRQVFLPFAFRPKATELITGRSSGLSGFSGLPTPIIGAVATVCLTFK